MAFDLKKLLEQSATAAPAPHAAIAIAVVNDVFRLAGLTPVPDATWGKWGERWPKRADEALGLIAALLVSTDLRGQTVATLKEPDAARHAVPGLTAFLERTEPLSEKLVRENAFRREEFLRIWIQVWGGTVLGEVESESVRRLAKLDYGATLRELARAEQHRKAEAAKREQALRAAAEAEAAAAAAQGWRE
jgi:hypothetical protein